ncbi:MAG TPA: protein translocase subunit SecF [Alphaproteobacteria bacterium]|nr:protein translocase subunit SecF [Alphaproteobacteria bacterium]|tara:strand:+ start:917 stop:1834 length:918 start_codon:yes stop_codon:yes gene_type:complete
MWSIKLIPADTKINFYRFRIFAFIASIFIVFLSIFFFFSKGLNYGIDFKGGIMIDVLFDSKPNLSEVRSKLDGLGIGDIEIQEFGKPENLLIKAQKQEGDEKEQIKAIKKIKDTLGNELDYRRTEFVGPKVGGELVEAGIWAVTLSLLAMLIYIWIRFEWQFGIGAVLALLHDVLTTIGLFSILNLEFNLAIVAAILTIAGYSINDTVVVYDRIRENLRKFRKEDVPSIINMSINQTLSRTTMTSLTTLLALIVLFYFGGEVIHGFVFAMIWGVFIGTYSSIFVASPLLNIFRLGGSEVRNDEKK